MRIALLIYSLGPGGAEGVMAELANELTARGHDVLLLTIHPEASDFHRVSPSVERRTLDRAAPSRNRAVALVRNVTNARSIRRAVRTWGADVAVSFIDRMNVLALAALHGVVPVVVSERIDPRSQTADLPTRLLRRLLYRYACAVVVQTEAVRRCATRWHPRVHVIANAVPDRFRATEARPEAADGGTIVAMGRLATQKAFDTLIRSFARLGRDRHGWCLVVYGDGPERERLERLVLELDLSDCVSLPGVTAHPEEVLAAADLFVLSSRHEGFPNVLLQAMACGAPVISTDCPSGPSEIVVDGVNGILVAVGDVDAMAEALRRLIGDPAHRRALAREAQEVRHRFSTEAISSQWETLMLECTPSR